MGILYMLILEKLQNVGFKNLKMKWTFKWAPTANATRLFIYFFLFFYFLRS